MLVNLGLPSPARHSLCTPASACCLRVAREEAKTRASSELSRVRMPGEPHELCYVTEQPIPTHRLSEATAEDHVAQKSRSSLVPFTEPPGANSLVLSLPALPLSPLFLMPPFQGERVHHPPTHPLSSKNDWEQLRVSQSSAGHCRGGRQQMAAGGHIAAQATPSAPHSP